MDLIYVSTLFAFKQPQQIFLETLEEPHFMVPLDHAFGNSQMDIYPWKCARDWIDVDVCHVISTIQAFLASTQSAKIEVVNFSGEMVYQVRLINYNIQIHSLNTD